VHLEPCPDVGLLYCFGSSWGSCNTAATGNADLPNLTSLPTTWSDAYPHREGLLRRHRNSVCPAGAPPRGGYRGGGRAQAGQAQMGGRAGPGPRRVYDEPEDVEFVKVMKGHARQVTTLAVDHGSSQARARRA